MNEWVSVKERLPIQQPEGWPTYNWVVVAKRGNENGELDAWNIARYTSKGWDLFGDSHCPTFSDDYYNLHADDIEYWMPLPELPDE